MNGDAIANQVAAKKPPTTVKMSLIASAMPWIGVRSASPKNWAANPNKMDSAIQWAITSWVKSIRHPPVTRGRRGMMGRP